MHKPTITSSQKFDADADQYARECQAQLDEIRSIQRQLTKPQAPLSDDRIIALFNTMGMSIDSSLSKSGLLESVHPDEKMRRAAEVSHQEMAKLASELELNRELFEVMAPLESKSFEDAQTRRFVTHTLRDFKRAGVDKDDATRERIKKINERLVFLGQEFNKNIRNDTRGIFLESPGDLKGLPDDYIKAHLPGDDGRIHITTDYPDYVPFMNYCRNAKGRRALSFEYQNRAYPVNIDVLHKILEFRKELANLIGHDTWAAYVTEDKMIRTSTAVADFIKKISDVSDQRSKRDVATLLKRKRVDEPDAQVIYDWERGFYSELVRLETLGFDSQEIRPYLEYTKVINGVLDVTQKLFGLTFEKSDKPVWHESVETFDVYRQGIHIGIFHLDMHPREGKYKHAAMFPIASGVDGVQPPEAALICNFSDPSTSSPALMEHSDVVTAFHEFGHLLHHIIGGHNQRFGRFSGVATEWDFVEVPSQLLEEWAWKYETLKTFAVHHETNQEIPEQLVACLNRARGFGRGAGVKQQMFYAGLALDYHSRDTQSLDTTAILKEMQQKFSCYPYTEDTHFHTSFGHLEGYSALYYTYMWSLVIAQDLLSKFNQSGMFEQKVANQYIEKVLEPGGVLDATDLIKGFLGRDYNLEAYKKWIETGE